MESKYSGRRVFKFKNTELNAANIIVENANEGIDATDIHARKVIEATEVDTNEKVYLHEGDFEEVKIEGRAYTKSEVLHILLDRADKERETSKYYEGCTHDVMARFINGGVVAVETETYRDGKFTNEVSYMSDGSIQRASYIDD